MEIFKISFFKKKKKTFKKKIKKRIFENAYIDVEKLFFIKKIYVDTTWIKNPFKNKGLI